MLKVREDLAAAERQLEQLKKETENRSHVDPVEEAKFKINSK